MLVDIPTVEVEGMECATTYSIENFRPKKKCDNCELKSKPSELIRIALPEGMASPTICGSCFQEAVNAASRATRMAEIDAWYAVNARVGR